MGACHLIHWAHSRHYSGATQTWPLACILGCYMYICPSTNAWCSVCLKMSGEDAPTISSGSMFQIRNVRGK